MVIKMKNKEMEDLKQEYMDIKIPEELDFIVRKSIKEGRKRMKVKKNIKKAKIGFTSAAMFAAILIVGLNTSHVMAETLSELPIIGNVVKVLTFKEYKLDEDGYNANIEVPEIAGLDNKDLENSLNEKYLAESKELYDQFIKDMDEMEELGGGHLGVDNGYVVMTDNDKILSIGRYVVNIVASSSTTFQYDTIDKEKEILITLPSLFKDDTYVDVISDNIKSQMREQMEADENIIYWLDGDGAIDDFDKISSEQSFYITDEGKLVISFDKYEVSPGYMGTPEFVISTEVISSILAGNEYIK